jgi:heme-degrading monooxygenase HmoA
VSSARIIRVWKGRGDADGVGRYCEDHFPKAVLPELQATPGFLGARVLTRLAEREVELVVATEWTGLDAVRAFAGDDVDRAVIEPVVRELLTSFDTQAEHFEVAVSARSSDR